jgi:hypothetical protein
MIPPARQEPAVGQATDWRRLRVGDDFFEATDAAVAVHCPAERVSVNPSSVTDVAPKAIS